ncbi:MAG: type II toxin-antitoxin system VapC family toxin [Deltaproteobacteria bacterium]|nr:MAG: type II toxin-antitoxin system VapC family toxin [Deltaproteobacteria bacterium]
MLVDANILLYAKIRDFEQHRRARSWLERQFNDCPRVGLPWPVLLAFLRIATNPRIFPRPMSGRAAWAEVRRWLELPNVWIPEPTERHADVMESLVAGTSVQADLFPDAHLAALAIEHGLELCSTDSDFARFQGLRYNNPLIES